MCKTHLCPSTEKRLLPKESASMLSFLALALLPKCPFCILSFGSAIAMCGTKNAETGLLGWRWELTLLWSAITLALILYNYKGSRTLYALGFALVGSGFILASYSYALFDQTFFYIGTILLFGGIWVNGSFGFFYTLIRGKLSSIPAHTSIRTH
ncbi:MAG: hypothetical protein AAF694_11720 [Bacteroidota bacterium]